MECRFELKLTETDSYGETVKEEHRRFKTVEDAMKYAEGKLNNIISYASIWEDGDHYPLACMVYGFNHWTQRPAGFELN